MRRIAQVTKRLSNLGRKKIDKLHRRRVGFAKSKQESLGFCGVFPGSTGCDFPHAERSSGRMVVYKVLVCRHEVRCPVSGLQLLYNPSSFIMARNSDKVETEAIAKPTDTNTETIEAAHDSTYSGVRDKAGQLLKEAGHSVVVSAAEDKRILRKIDLAILPIILVTYTLQFLDKSTLSYASVFGILEDANLHGDQYSWLGSVVYVAQLVWQPVIAWMLVKFPIGRYAWIDLIPRSGYH